jgi:hypothetical protein
VSRPSGIRTRYMRAIPGQVRQLLAVERYRHAQLSAMRLSGDLNMRPENVNLDELLESIRQEWVKLGPLIDMGPGAPQGSRTEGSSVGSKRIERRDQRSGV